MSARDMPMQPIHIAADKVLRFKGNRIVEKLLEVASSHGYGLNQIAMDAHEGKYTKDEQRQLAQLIGYSLSGYSEMQSYVTDRAWEKACQAVQHSNIPAQIKESYKP